MKTVKTIVQNKTCPKCKGSGRVFDKTECVFTFGISFVLGLIDNDLKDPCPMCGGDGYIQEKTIIIQENID